MMVLVVVVGGGFDGFSEQIVVDEWWLKRVEWMVGKIR